MANEPFASYLLPKVSKRVFEQNHSNENDFDLHKNGHAGETHQWFRRLVLKQRQKVTRKWPINKLLSVMTDLVNTERATFPVQK